MHRHGQVHRKINVSLMLKIRILLIMSFNYGLEHFRKKTSKRRIFDYFVQLWRFRHISFVRTPIDVIQDVSES